RDDRVDRTGGRGPRRQEIRPRADPAVPRRQHRRRAVAGHPPRLHHPLPPHPRTTPRRRRHPRTRPPRRRHRRNRRHPHRPAGRTDGGGDVTVSADHSSPRLTAAELPPPDGRLGIIAVGDIALENGATVPDVHLAVQRWGELSPGLDNVVLVEHALTGDSHVVGGPDEIHPQPGWWEGMVGPGAPLDTDEWCIVATNVLGGCKGSTGPSSPAPDGKPWGSRFPEISIRDQVTAEAALLDRLGV